MIGFPRLLRTRQDFLNCHKMAIEGKLSRKKMIDQWKSLVENNRHQLFNFKKDQIDDKISELENIHD